MIAFTLVQAQAVNGGLCSRRKLYTFDRAAPEKWLLESGLAPTENEIVNAEARRAMSDFKYGLAASPT